MGLQNMNLVPYEQDEECNRGMSEVWYAFDELMTLPGQEYRQKKCFLGVAESKDIYDASYDCQLKGGSLISIHSQDNLDTILATLDKTEGDGYWIGLEWKYDYIAEEYAYGWEDESIVNFFNWDDGQPGKHLFNDYTYLDRSTGTSQQFSVCSTIF